SLRGHPVRPARAEGVDDASAPPCSGDRPMTADHPVRRVLAPVCSPDTMSRLVDPTLADMRFERGRRPAWRGYLALARALTVHAIASSPGRARQIWAEDERAMPKAVFACAATAVAAALALVAPPLLEVGFPQR